MAWICTKSKAGSGEGSSILLECHEWEENGEKGGRRYLTKLKHVLACSSHLGGLECN